MRHLSKKSFSLYNTQNTWFSNYRKWVVYAAEFSLLYYYLHAWLYVKYAKI